MIPSPDCDICPRLRAYRLDNKIKEPAWHNAPVPSFGPLTAQILVVGLAPGVRGANRTGRPFTGDYAGLLLYATLQKFGLATGRYLEHPDDGLLLSDCRITNAVRCVPPQNLPTTTEAHACNQFLASEIKVMSNLRAILTLGIVSHAMTLRALGMRPSTFKFAHGARHQIKSGLAIVNSYHVSRYNTSTKRLNTEMFESAVQSLLQAVND